MRADDSQRSFKCIVQNALDAVEFDVAAALLVRANKLNVKVDRVHYRLLVRELALRAANAGEHDIIAMLHQAALVEWQGIVALEEHAGIIRNVLDYYLFKDMMKAAHDSRSLHQVVMLHRAALYAKGEGRLAPAGASSVAAEAKKGRSGLEHILVHDPKMPATRAAKLLRLKLNQEGAQRERYLADVVWRVRTPVDARAALAATELFTQHRAARLQLRPYKKYVSEKLIERALKAGAREVATQALQRADELELRVSVIMLKKAVIAASTAGDLDSLATLYQASVREGFAKQMHYPIVRDDAVSAMPSAAADIATAGLTSDPAPAAEAAAAAAAATGDAPENVAAVEAVVLKPAGPGPADQP
ncbi:hypothetical protein WJX81_006131 [Elliptochloris bilobata]|uniref:PCI domain-containing protein n=1 Tax=Elliptochloris bilobata TaxID=381761 RepID=A0AAW1QUV6_9CHLO